LAKWSKLHVTLQIILQHDKEREIGKSEGKCSKYRKAYMMRDLEELKDRFDVKNQCEV